MELDSHVREFEALCNCEVDVPIRIKVIPSTKKGYRTLGVCYGFRMPTVFRSIEIDQEYWRTASFYERESTVFHELAHCVLDLEHTDELTGDFLMSLRPKSLMYPYSFSDYETYRKEYIRELFSRKPGPWDPNL